MKTRITELLGVKYPIVQAPMGWIARAQLASAVSNAGGLGIIETSSGRLDEVREEVAKMKGLTDKPWGINVAQAFVRDPDIVSFVADQGVLGLASTFVPFFGRPAKTPRGAVTLVALVATTSSLISWGLSPMSFVTSSSITLV